MADYKVLIVDDEEDLREVLVHQLKPVIKSLDTAANGNRAIELIRLQPYDAVLSDINMPGMTGLELLANLRRDGFDLPFVILTGFGDKAKAVEALRLGAFDFLEKPWDAGNIREVMASAADHGQRLRQARRELEKSLNGVADLPTDQAVRLRKFQKAVLDLKVQRGTIKKLGS